MSLLKVFVSSTCYDLANVRENLRNFLVNLSYEPVMSDYSDVLYDPRVHTHTSCVEEIKNSDIVILIIGGRFGGKASTEAVSMINFDIISKDLTAEDGNFSITQLEYLKATECRIPVYTFIEESVLSDHKLYEYNKNKDTNIVNQISFPSIDKPETARYIFEFINTIRRRDRGNNIFAFKKIADIEETLKKQWSSLFQRMIKEQLPTKPDNNIVALEKKVDELTKLIWKFINETPRDRNPQVNAKKKQRRILWVDDYPSNNDSVVSFFEAQNIHFDIAISTEQGLNFYQHESYDIIITDMGRGERGNAGIDLIKELNALHCRVPIVVYCSWHAMQRYGEEAIQLGAHSVIYGINNITSLITDFTGLHN